MSTKKTTTATIYAKAKEALVLNNNDIESAAATLYAWARKDRTLRTELLKRAVVDAVRSVLANFRHHDWNVLSKEPNPDNPSGLLAVASFNLSLYEYFLPGGGGKQLGDATREEVEAAALFHKRLEKTHAERGVWFAAIVERMGKTNKTVREKIPEKELRQLLEWAKNQ